MKAEEAAKFVAKYIGCQWPADKAKIYEILQLGLNKAHKEGKWLGMTKEYTVPKKHTSRESFIIGRTDYPILLAVNIDGTPTDIRSPHFHFHRNGNGSIINRPGCRWNQDVYDIGYVPIIDENRININSGVYVAVRALGNPGPNEKVWINGFHSNQQRVFTYQAKTGGLDQCKCKIEKDTVKTQEGVEIEVLPNQIHYIGNIRFSEITSITKTPTRTPIEIIVINCENQADPVAVLMPNQTESKYRRYTVPDSCCDTVHGLFKIAEQDNIISGTEDLIISDKEVLIALCMAIDYIYHKKDPNTGAGYFINAIGLLNKQKLEEESPDVCPLQMQRVLDGDTPEILKHMI